MQELYDKLVAMRDKLETFKFINDVKDHLEEIKLCISMIDTKSINAKNEDFVRSILEDALKDAEKTISEYPHMRPQE